jgi:Conserved oligomeric complex COG6
VTRARAWLAASPGYARAWWPQVRIEQVLVSAPPLLLCFKLSQLLSFYRDTVEALLGPAAQLSETLRGCRAVSSRLFHEQLRQRGDKLLRYPPPPPSDFSPPPQVRPPPPTPAARFLQSCGHKHADRTSTLYRLIGRHGRSMGDR